LLYAAAMNNISKKSAAPVNAAQPQDTEKMLLQRLENSANEEEYFRWMLFTVGYYRGIQKIEPAKKLLRNFLTVNQKPDYHVQCHLALGQMATDEQELELAIREFTAALELRPESKKIEYILENNLGYCYNMVGRWDEAEKHCRAALVLNWTRPSAYRNLGISFRGQGKLAAAAWALLEAVKMEPTDERARVLLKSLAIEVPWLVLQCPWVLQGIDPAGSVPKQETVSG
jgi:tetratricopeptide (TPR) repeat protein